MTSGADAPLSGGNCLALGYCHTLKSDAPQSRDKHQEATMPANEIQVILVPGADRLAFSADTAQAAARGATVHPLTLPAFSGHPIDDQAAYYADMAGLIGAALKDARRAGGPVFGFGRNLGGSLLGHAVAQGAAFDGVVLIGAIPSLSDFRLHGNHPSARRFRAALGGDTSRIDLIEPLDLTASLRAFDPQLCLIQVGRDDPYMDARSDEIFQRLEANFQVEYYPDGHAMTASATIARRWDFIAG
jgi:hypothetical protein